ncbi:hypothetical protein G3578_07295 [Brevibacillus sp. SYP-B805]|uniref:hypothetical protein n=1 Tax=Brevibacillus sp. SYP-B805 TaxID=1578199 RepID=UPI0013EC4608|nr:hypothetical protein [Brevibacillus sp. SYP-B805]NGQ94989.1 hypothetical protein [Brevibacillus sp. SYP-B805]
MNYLQHDKSRIETAPVRFPAQYANHLHSLAMTANARAKEEYRQLARAGVSILGVVMDRGEHFVMWRQRGETHLFRIHENKLRAEAQKRLDSMADDSA